MLSPKQSTTNPEMENGHNSHKRKKTIKIIAIITLLLLLFSQTACSKENVINGYKNAIELIGKIAVTSDGRLVGKRQKGPNTYTGTYSADYKEYCETEFPFGGTSLEPPGDGKLTVKCTLSIESGTVAIFFSSLGESTPLAGAPGEYTYTLELPPGANYIGVHGSEFTGTLTIEAQ